MSYQRDINDGWRYGPQTVILLLFLVTLAIFGGFQIRKVLLPAEESLRREVYEESKSYIDGTIRDLDNLRMQWLTADTEPQRTAIANVAKHRSVDFPEEYLPEHLKAWIDSIR